MVELSFSAADAPCSVGRVDGLNTIAAAPQLTLYAIRAGTLATSLNQCVRGCANKSLGKHVSHVPMLTQHH